MTTSNTSAIVIRHAGDADVATLADLAILDSREPIGGHALIAEVDGVARAALDLDDGSVAADPFAYTGELVDLLRVRARGSRTGRHSRSLRDRLPVLPRPLSLRA